MIEARDVISETPNDAQHPRMYEGATYLLGGVAVLVALVMAVLAFTGQTPPDALGAMGLTAVGGLVGLLTRQK